MFRAYVGFSDNPDTEAAGQAAAREALARAGTNRPCDLVFLFATASHDPYLLLEAIGAVVGRETTVVGGSAVGVIVNDRFGYGGDQVGLAAFWFDEVRYNLVTTGDLTDNEENAGRLLGAKLIAAGFKPEMPAMLFCDAIDRTHGDIRLHLATPFLAGLEQALGYLPPKLVGAGLQGDYECSPSHVWTGAGAANRHVFAGNSRRNTTTVDTTS